MVSPIILPRIKGPTILPTPLKDWARFILIDSFSGSPSFVMYGLQFVSRVADPQAITNIANKKSE